MKYYKLYILSLLILLLATCSFVQYQDYQWLKLKLAKTDKKQVKATFAKERFQQYVDERGGYIDHELVSSVRSEYAKNLKKIKSKKPLKDGGIAGWNWLGPGNIGGRSRCVAIDPTNDNEIFFGSVKGGLWKSNNAGASWFPIDDFWGSLSVTDIVFDDVNPNIMYVATGEFGSFGTGALATSGGLPGEGIFKSTNGGSSWSRLSSTANFKWIPRMATVPGRSNEIYALIANGGDSGLTGGGTVRKSTDGGQTWPTVVNLATTPQSIAVNPNDVRQVMVGCSNNLYTNLSGVFNSSNFVDILGTSAGQIPDTSGRIEIAFGQNVLYAWCNMGTGQLWSSTNSGASWTKKEDDESIINQGNYCMSLWVDPSDDDNVMVGGLDIWYSDDGGDDFSKVSDWGDYHDGGGSAHADQHWIVSSQNYNGSTNNFIYVANDGGIQRSTFASSSWTNLANNLGVTTFTSGAISKDGSRYIGGAHDNSFSVGDNSTNWVQKITGDGGATLVDQNDKDNLYSFTQNARLWKSTNGGSSWSNPISFSNIDRPLFYAPLEMDPLNSSIIYAGARRLYQSPDEAANFNMVKDSLSVNGFISTIEVSGANTNVIWVGYNDGVISRTSNINNIGSWVDNMDPGNAIPNAYIMDIAVHPTNDAMVAVVIGGYRNDQVWFSDDTGTTWNDISNNLPGVHVNTVTWHPSNQNYLYIGTDLGVYASDNQGDDWNIDPLYTGNSDGPVNTQISELFWQGDGSSNFPYFLCAATSGRGLWRSNGPVDRNLYVNKNYTGIEFGTTTKPFNTFREAIDAASDGRTIFFNSTGTHDEIPSTILINKRVDIKLNNGSVPVVIK